MKNAKKILSTLLLVSVLTLGFNVMAFAKTESNAEEVMNIDEISMESQRQDVMNQRGYVAGGVASGYYNGEVKINIPSGSSVNEIWISTVDADNRTSRGVKYYVTGPNGFNSGTLTIDGQRHTFPLKNAIAGGQTVTFKFQMVDNYVLEHRYECAIWLNQN